MNDIVLPRSIAEKLLIKITNELVQYYDDPRLVGTKPDSLIELKKALEYSLKPENILSQNTKEACNG